MLNYPVVVANGFDINANLDSGFAGSPH